MPRTSYSPTSILSVIVLYNRELAHSQSFTSLLQILKENPEWAKHFSLMLYDNSPQPQSHTLQANFPIHYVHDPSNGGLASAYNSALLQAESEAREWLLLLDQDTSPTREFISELLETVTSLDAATEVAAVVPKLMVQGFVHSPAVQFIDQMRRQFQAPKGPIDRNVTGVLQQPMSAYNSGATIRVAALRSIGGFPPEFWLDFLDHAVFHALHAHGYRMYVLRATLVHDASHSDIGSVPSWRLHNVLMAQTLYVKRRGNFMDRLLYRIWLLRNSRNLRHDPRMRRETVMQAFRLRVPKDPREGLPAQAPGWEK
jgi:GT2 family glycosyltransferase